MGSSVKPADGDAVDNCAVKTPQTYGYAWEQKTYTGYEDSWQSDPLCVNDLKVIDYAREQLAMVIRTGVEFGVSMLENWNREQYLQFAADANRTMILMDGAVGFEGSANYRFTYDPALTTTDVDGETTGYITFPATAKVSTLNFAFLDYLRVTMSERCPGSALSQSNGLPMFGLMIDIMDFERMVKADDKLHTEFLYATPQKLIDGYDMGMTQFRGFALMHDKRQARFRILSSDGTDVTATRVEPVIDGEAVNHGFIPEPNPDYYNAPLAIGVIFQNDVFMNRFMPSIDSLGSGTKFGPAPGLTGLWSWVNVKDPVTNMLGEEGFFYGRFQIFPKPLMYSNDATVFLYSRCAHAYATECEVNTLDETASGSTAVAVAVNAVTADVDLVNDRVTLTLATKVALSIGDAVTIDLDGAGDDLAAQVADTAAAPTYDFVWVSGATGDPDAYTEFTTSTTVILA
jgi:hypothetical protein